MSESITYTFELDAKTHSALKKIADGEHRTLAGQIRMIIEEWLQNQ